jgi:hypothetical protein
MEMTTMTTGERFPIDYDPEERMSYGSWRCPECAAHFYGGGRPMHDRGCPLRGAMKHELDYSGLRFVVGDVAIQHAVRFAAHRNDADARAPVLPVSAAEIRAQLPEEVARIEAEAKVPDDEQRG